MSLGLMSVCVPQVSECVYQVSAKYMEWFLKYYAFYVLKITKFIRQLSPLSREMTSSILIFMYVPRLTKHCVLRSSPITEAVLEILPFLCFVEN